MNSVNLEQPLEHSLEQYFGFNQFRGGQKKTIEQLLSQQSSLAIFPTGSGKSLCYQLTALYLPNLTLVVSPLLALMKDQVDFLNSKGIAAASLDSTLTPEQYKDTIKRVKSGEIKILMVSVERFKNERFRNFIDQVRISMLVIDEAHCISEWGHNFRPDYLKLPKYREELKIPLVLLLTATATKKVKLDMAAKFKIESNNIVQTGFYRSNLTVDIKAIKESEKMDFLTKIIQSKIEKDNQCAGIVYVTLQKSAQNIADFLVDQGINAKAYHAGLDNAVRQKIQLDFMANKINVVVATIAFGMGVDKSNIRFVMHYDLPKSIENFSQEIGRAGRDGAPSHCMTLANLDGINTIENFVYGDTPEQKSILLVLNDLKTHSQNYNQKIVWEMQINQLSNQCNVKQLPLKTLLVQLELLDVIKPLYSYYAEFNVKLLVDENRVLDGFNEQRKSFLQAIFKNTHFKKTWGQVNFDAMYQKNHQNFDCSRQRIITALEYLQEQNLVELQSKLITDVYEVNQSKLADVDQLSNELFNYFKGNEIKEIKRIKSLVRFFELEKCLTKNLALYFDDQQSPENCGHCSVCKNKAVKLFKSVTHQTPSLEYISTYLVGLENAAQSKKIALLSLDEKCRFLVGMNMPIFTKMKARTLRGFASCEHVRYEDLLRIVGDIKG